MVLTDALRQVNSNSHDLVGNFESQARALPDTKFLMEEHSRKTPDLNKELKPKHS